MAEHQQAPTPRRALDRALIGSAILCAGIVLWSGPRDLPLLQWLPMVPFAGWVLLPLMLVRRMVRPVDDDRTGQHGSAHWTMLGLAWLLAIGTPLLYAATMFGRKSSTAALVFAFLPLYQLLLIGAVRLISGWLTPRPDGSR